MTPERSSQQTADVNSPGMVPPFPAKPKGGNSAFCQHSHMYSLYAANLLPLTR